MQARGPRLWKQRSNRDGCGWAILTACPCKCIPSHDDDGGDTAVQRRRRGSGSAKAPVCVCAESYARQPLPWLFPSLSVLSVSVSLSWSPWTMPTPMLKPNANRGLKKKSPHSGLRFRNAAFAAAAHGLGTYTWTLVRRIGLGVVTVMVWSWCGRRLPGYGKQVKAKNRRRKIRNSESKMVPRRVWVSLG
jgi:hypothetical protein